MEYFVAWRAYHANRLARFQNIGIELLAVGSGHHDVSHATGVHRRLLEDAVRTSVMANMTN